MSVGLERDDEGHMQERDIRRRRTQAHLHGRGTAAGSSQAHWCAWESL